MRLLHRILPIRIVQRSGALLIVMRQHAESEPCPPALSD